MKRQFWLKIAAVAAIFAVMLSGCAASETTNDIPADGSSSVVSDGSAQSGDNTSSDSSDDKASSDSSDDKTSSDGSGDNTSSDSSDDKASSDSSDDKTSSDGSDDKISSDNSKDNTTSGNAQTQKPQTEAPATKAPQTEAPATKAPQTEAPATKAPQTEAPATKAPQTEAPATKPVQTNPPATKPPQTNPPATNPPQTNPPATKAPQTKPPAATKAPEKPAVCTNHKWKVSSVIKDATCLREGQAEYTCTVCGAKKTDTLAMKEHSWNTQKYADGDTCVLFQKCTECGATHTEYGQHEYKRTKNVESTSSKDGYTTYSCTKCGDGFTLTQKAGTNNNMPMKYNDIYNKLIAFKSKYPEGMAWDNSKVYKTVYTDSKGIKTNFTAKGCTAFALELSDSLFKGKDVPKNYTLNINKLRIGDMLRINNDTHSVIILDVGPEGVVIAEGNYNSSIHWGRFISASELKQVFTYSSTRY